ncbi:glycosyltransferase family 2 protein [Mesoterricola sediminis]|uniref:Glycosyltransferase 2-like domain-containing protein n=1 Tax=Mesoterricola sediminis TaxID=2927980 RepID=A0AA48KB32_9BACT|nr:glycosyltransferase family 2 protein [Mesoterricola sediminis]BDU75694.1 hypothetical protein METESE_06520 [Mesoterricola sediminis]
MPEAPRVLAVVPVYNHAATLPGVVQGLLAQDLDVLVVDDGSTDDPLASLGGLPLRSLRLDPNQGKGAALLAAARWAQAEGYDLLLTLDADGQHLPADAPRLLAEARAHWPALVVGNRAMEDEHVPWSSRFGRAFSNGWVRLECGRRLGDTQSGFRAYPVAFLVRTPFLTRRYTFEVEVLVKAAWAGLPIRDVPVRVIYPPAGERISHFRAFRDNARLTALHTWLVTCRLWALATGRSYLGRRATTSAKEKDSA